MIIISSRLCTFFAWFSRYSKTAKAVTVFPFIFVRAREEIKPWLINHERIHLRQQLELFIIGAFLLTLLEFFYALIFLRLTWYEAYLFSSAEQEAYRNQNNNDYLKTRKPFAQFWYLIHKKQFTHQEGVITYVN